MATSSSSRLQPAFGVRSSDRADRLTNRLTAVCRDLARSVARHMMFVKVQNGLDRVQAGQVAVIRDHGLEQNCCLGDDRCWRLTLPLYTTKPAGLWEM